MNWKRFRPWFRKTKAKTLNWPGRLRPALFGVMVSMLLLASGCNGGSAVQLKPAAPNQSDQQTVEGNGEALLNDGAATSENTVITPAQQDATSSGPTDPLRGTPSEHQLSRPIQVMVENAPQARPQTGLDQADIIYEILAEGEITRFAAIFHSHQPDKIGPVRSIRPYYVQIGHEIDAVIVHAGWSQDASNAMQHYKVNHFDEVYGDGAYYWRDSARKKPHNLFTGIDKILTGMKNKKFSTEWEEKHFSFDETSTGLLASTDATTATELHIPYLHGYQVDYQWDDQQKRYLRSMDGKPHKDAASGNQLVAANVLICKAKHQVLDEKLRRAVDVVGPGKGWLAQNGRIVPVTWKMSGGIVRAFDANGTEFAMNPGQTWIQFVETGADVKWN